MLNYKTNKNSSKASEEEETVHGFIPRSCDLKCYKCRYQGICIIPRRIIEARKRFVINNLLGLPLLNNKYRLNDYPKIMSYGKKILRYLINLKKKLYNRDSD